MRPPVQSSFFFYVFLILMSTDIDIEMFRAEPSDRSLPQNSKPLVRRQGYWFVRGPLPGPWLTAAGLLPGKCLHVGLALWFEFGVTKRADLTLTHGLLRKFGVKPKAGARALKQLELAGLVSVVRHPGRSPVVTILEAPP